MFQSKLEFIDLSENEIYSMKGIENFENLKRLYLFDNRIKKIEGLEKLILLKDLGLGQNEVTEIRGLDTLVNLEGLCLSSNPISEAKGIEHLKKLKEFEIMYTRISDDAEWKGPWVEKCKYFRLAHDYTESGQYKKAIMECEEYLKLEPGDDYITMVRNSLTMFLRH